MKSLETKLNDRILRFDGISIVDPDSLIEAILAGVPLTRLRTTHITPDVTSFNSKVKHDDKIKLAEDSVNLSLRWQLPSKYVNLNIEGFILDKFQEFGKNLSTEDLEIASKRVLDELDEIDRRGLSNLFKTIVYVIDKFKEENVIWGVGRGSSCASYILFILGLHSVDCLRYEIDFNEFFHD